MRPRTFPQFKIEELNLNSGNVITARSTFAHLSVTSAPSALKKERTRMHETPRMHGRPPPEKPVGGRKPMPVREFEPSPACAPGDGSSSEAAAESLDRDVLLMGNFRPQLFRGLEDRDRAGRHFYRIASARVTRHPRTTLPYFERTEAADLDVRMLRHRFLDRVQEPVHHQGTVFLGDSGADRFRHLLDEIGFGHDASKLEGLIRALGSARGLRELQT